MIVIHHNPDRGTSRNVLALVEAAGYTHEVILQPSVTDETLLKAMLEHPVLVNRPFVCTPKGVRLCRPSEMVLDLLDRWPEGPVYKEDGQMILDSPGQKVI